MLTAEPFASLEQMPGPARALFGSDDIYGTLPWYGASAARALPANAKADFLVIADDARTLGVFPLQHRAGRQLAALTTPYTGAWQPLLDAALSADELASVAKTFLLYARRFPLTRLDCIDAGQPFWRVLSMQARGLRLAPLTFDHFGNWQERLAPGAGWAAYLAARPGTLREAIRRKSARLLKDSANRIAIVNKPDALDDAISAYRDIYAASWKKPEPFPDFFSAFMRAAAEAGSLRLALLSTRHGPIAAQIWTVYNGVATVMKLAHRQGTEKLSPGTVLTAAAIRHFIDDEAVHTLDFGRGDDGYKQLWASERRQHSGIIIANPATAAGLRTILQHGMGYALRRLIGRRPIGPLA